MPGRLRRGHHRWSAATGANLLHRGAAESGAASLHGWDAVTIPGRNVAAGLPTVVRYGDQGFPRGRGGQLFVGGAGGTARLVQTLAPGGPTAIVLGTYDGTVRLLNTRTHRASAPIKVGALPVATAVTR